MTAHEEVQKISNQLEALVKESISGSEEVIEFLRALEKLPIDLNILQSTNIGRTVNSLRKETKKDEVAGICKSLVKSWKGLLKEKPANENGLDQLETGKSSKPAEPEKKKMKKEENGTDGSSTSSREKAPLGGTLSRSSSSSSLTSSPAPLPPLAKAALLKTQSGGTKSTRGPVFHDSGDTSTTDAVRLRSRELLVKALLKDTLPEGADDAETIAAGTETAIFKEFRNTDVKYKNRIRSRIMSVQDAKNPRLRENILLGHITPERLAVMTSEEMASKEMKELRDRLSKEAINDSQISTGGGTETDLLQCGKCKQRKCTYNQVQTRSADEPMTTFVYCNNCGNRWKFC